jgi:hypothetical protein
MSLLSGLIPFTNELREALMISTADNDRRSGKDRRSGRERRQTSYSRFEYPPSGPNGLELKKVKSWRIIDLRNGKDRRSGQDRRKSNLGKAS